MAAEMKKYLVGPMPVQQFLDYFFPVKELPHLSDVPQFKTSQYNATIKAKSEVNSYNLFVSFSYRIVNLSKVPDCNPLLNFPYKIKPDISVYSINLDHRVATDSSKVEMLLEFKWKINDSPFCEVYDVVHPNGKAGKTVKSFLRNTKAAKDTLGQITAYPATQFGA